MNTTLWHSLGCDASHCLFGVINACVDTAVDLANDIAANWRGDLEGIAEWLRRGCGHRGRVWTMIVVVRTVHLPDRIQRCSFREGVLLEFLARTIDLNLNAPWRALRCMRMHPRATDLAFWSSILQNLLWDLQLPSEEKDNAETTLNTHGARQLWAVMWQSPGWPAPKHCVWVCLAIFVLPPPGCKTRGGLNIDGGWTSGGTKHPRDAKVPECARAAPVCAWQFALFYCFGIPARVKGVPACVVEPASMFVGGFQGCLTDQYTVYAGCWHNTPDG